MFCIVYLYYLSFRQNYISISIGRLSSVNIRKEEGKHGGVDIYLRLLFSTIDIRVG